jgi:putative tryptophan/tyrosine transport system substrate-binding protein
MDYLPTRRQFVQGAGVAGLGLLAGCGRWPWQAEQPARVPQIGYLMHRSGATEFDQAFLEALRSLDYVEGQNIAIEWRFSDGDDTALPALATELVDRQVNVLVTASSAIPAAKDATSRIPIVMATSGDPVSDGFVVSLGRPGGNITGLSALHPSLTGKRLELLKDVVPRVSRVAVLRNAGNPSSEREFSETEAAGQILDLELQPLPLRRGEDLEEAFAAATAYGAHALLVLSDAFTFTHRRRIIELAVDSRLPSMFPTKAYTEAGGLICYGPNVVDLYRRAAYYVDRILKGTKPADLPVEQPMRFDFVVNLKTAKELGITFPNEIMLQVTEVIQ